MRRFKSTVSSLLSCIFLLPATGFAQSGRGRPVTPGRETRPTITPTVTVPEATTVVKQEQAGSLSRFVLKNGITVIINEQYATPVVAAVAEFKAGAADEAEDMAGAAALLARVMHRGTTFRSGEKLAADIRAVGGLMDAETAFAHTAFRVLAPADKSKEALAVQADLVQNPALAEEEVRKEMALSASADDMGFYSPGSGAEHHAFSRLQQLAFAGDAIGRAPRPSPALGRNHLLQFYKKHFRPDNMIIAVAGAVSTFNTLVEIQRLYGTFKKQEPVPTQETNRPVNSMDAAGAAKSKSSSPPSPRPVQARENPPRGGKETAGEVKPPPPPAPAAPAPAPPPADALRYANERGLLHQSIVSVGFRLTGLTAKERDTLEVLSALLGEGRGSRLHRSLFAAQQAVYRVESRLTTFSDRGLLAVQMWTAPTGVDKAESALFRELNRLKREVPTEAEMARARLQIENRFFAENGTTLNRARLLARAEASTGFRSLLDYPKRVAAVTAEEVQRAAAKYLTLTSTAVFEFEASTAPPRSFEADKLAQTVTAWAPTFAAAVDPKEVRVSDDKSLASISAGGIEKAADELAVLESIQPLPVKNFSTLNGPQAYVREDHTQPRVTIALLFQGGRLVEDEGNAGITELMLRWMLYGTAKRPQAAQELEQHGAAVEIVVAGDYYGFIVGVLSNNADRVLRIARDLIEEPAYRDEDFNLARAEQMTRLYGDRDSAFTRARELFLQSLFAGHVYAQPAHGNEAALARLKEDDVRAWHGQTVKRQMPLVVIVGDTEGSALVSSELATGFKRNDVEATLKARVPAATKPGEKIEARGFAHTVFALAFPGPKGTEERIAIDVLKAALNGNNGRLKAELRDRQGITYRAYFDDFTSLAAGSLEFFISSSPENEPRARAVLLAEVDRLAKSGLAAEDLASAKAVARTLALVRLQSQRQRALEYAESVFYQKAATDVDNIESRLGKVTAEDVKRVTTAYFKANTASSGLVRGK